MTEQRDDATTPARTAGSILREARQAQGVHIGALAATIKVSQKKLESLEADRLDELPDPTFTRALAQTVCRALKIDPAPVLALLPMHAGHRLEHVAEGLRQPFHERSSRSESSDWIGTMGSPAIWGVLAIVVLTVVVWLMPQHWLSALQPSSGASAPASAASASTVTSTVLVPPAAEAASAVPADAAASAAVATSEPAFAPAPAIAASGVSGVPAGGRDDAVRSEVQASRRP